MFNETKKLKRRIIQLEDQLNTLEHTLIRETNEVRQDFPSVYFKECPLCKRPTLTRSTDSYNEQLKGWFPCCECLICGTKYTVEVSHVPINTKKEEGNQCKQ